MKSTAKNTILRFVIFLCILFLVFVYLNKVFTLPEEDENTKIFNSFYGETENSLDGIYLGSSAVNRFWNAPLAYHEYGYSIFAFSTSSQPLVLYRNLIREAEKTQSPKLYILELRDVTESAENIMEEGIRRVTDNMPLFSLNRIDTINTALDYADQGENNVDKNRMDYYLPIIKYHGMWTQNKLSADDLLLRNTKDPSKGFLLGKKSFGQVSQEKPLQTGERRPLAKETEDALRKLLDYCDTLDAKVLFVLSPYSEQEEKEREWINEAVRIVEEKGYPVLNFLDEELLEDLNLDWDKHYYDSKHVNILGAEVYTKYLAEYIKAHYDLADHRDDKQYKSWDEAYEYYLDFTKEKRAQMEE